MALLLCSGGGSTLSESVPCRLIFYHDFLPVTCTIPVGEQSLGLYQINKLSLIAFVVAQGLFSHAQGIIQHERQGKLMAIRPLDFQLQFLDTNVQFLKFLSERVKASRRDSTSLILFSAIISVIIDLLAYYRL